MEVVAVVVVVVVLVEEGVGAAMGAMIIGASLEVGGVMAAASAPVSVGFIANRSSSGAMSALPSVVAKGSSQRAAGWWRSGVREGVMIRKEGNGSVERG